jgi:hypothetical protein
VSEDLCRDSQVLGLEGRLLHAIVLLDEADGREDADEDESDGERHRMAKVFRIGHDVEAKSWKGMEKMKRSFQCVTSLAGNDAKPCMAPSSFSQLSHQEPYKHPAFGHDTAIYSGPPLRVIPS